MKSGFSFTAFKASFARIGNFFFTYNRMIYFVVFFCVLGIALLGLNLILNQPSDEEYRTQKMSEAESPRFDTDTIKKIQNLNAKQQTITEAPPAGQRSNPFSE